MHRAVIDYVSEAAVKYGMGGRVLEFGGRYVNGSVRDLILSYHWVGVDIEDGPDVDIVANAATVDHEPGTWDVVVTTELLEHTPEGEAIIANAYRHLRPGGWFVATMAGPGRPEHSASGWKFLPKGEWYRNVTADDLTGWLKAAGFTEFQVDPLEDDMRCVARKADS